MANNQQRSRERDDQLIDLVQRLAEAEATVHALMTTPTDAVIDQLNAARTLLESARESLSRLEVWQQEFIKRIPAIFCRLAPDGTTLFVNDVVSRATGYSPDELQGKNFWDTLCPAEQRHQVDNLIKQLRRGDVVDWELAVTAQDGSKRTLLWNSCCDYLSDGTLESINVFGMDITRRKRASEEQARMAAILKATSDFVGTADIHGRCTYLNKAARTMLEIGDDEDISSRKISDCHPEWSARLVTGVGLPTAAKQGIWSGETALLSRTGSEIPVSQVIIAHKAPDGTVEFFSTIARRRRERNVLGESAP